MLAVPFLVTLRVLCDHLPGLAALGEFLSERRSENGTASNPSKNVEQYEQNDDRDRNPDQPQQSAAHVAISSHELSSVSSVKLSRCAN